MTATAKLIHAQRECLNSLRVFASDVGHGLLVVGHNSLALVGLGLVTAAAMVVTNTELRHDIERHALSWLSQRHESRSESTDPSEKSGEPDAVNRATAADPRALPREQMAVAQWLARRYRVAPEPVSRLVQEAWQVGQQVRLDPTLILAVIAIESSFNPFAQSHVGAQGLMQVMTRIHDRKYEVFGGAHAAFDPVTNLRVGAQVLRECINRAGSLEQGLRYYVGAANLSHDGGYAARVLAEQGNMRQVMRGKYVPITASLPSYLSPQGLRTNLAQSPSPEEGSLPEKLALAR